MALQQSERLDRNERRSSAKEATSCVVSDAGHQPREAKVSRTAVRRTTVLSHNLSAGLLFTWYFANQCVLLCPHFLASFPPSVLGRAQCKTEPVRNTGVNHEVGGVESLMRPKPALMSSEIARCASSASCKARTMLGSSSPLSFFSMLLGSKSIPWTPDEAIL